MDLISQLKRDEGGRLKPYLDSVGKTTIGYGRNLTDEGITPEEAEYLLSHDIQTAEQRLAQHLPWAASLDEVRRAVLVNMVFNMGASLFGFKNTLSLIQQGQYAAAADEMLKSKWAEQVGPRAVRLAQQLRTGIFQ